MNSLIGVYTICHFQQSDQGLHCLPFSAVWSGSTLFAILSSLIKVKVYAVIPNSVIRVYTICHSQQSDQGLHYFPFSTVWSGSTPFAILSSLIKVYTVCHSQEQSNSGVLKIYEMKSTLWYLQRTDLSDIASNLETKVLYICEKLNSQVLSS